MIAALVTVAAVALAAIGAVVWATRTALERGDRAAAADVRAATGAALASAQISQLEARVQTQTGLIADAEAQVASLEEELADADRATIVDPDPGSRRRVVRRWREARAVRAAAAAVGGGGAGPVPDSAAAGPATEPGRDP